VRSRLLTAGLLLASCAHPERAGRAPCEAALQATSEAELRIIDTGERIDATIDEQIRSPAQREAVERAEVLLASRTRAVDRRDLAILDRAAALLGADATWNRADTRTCEPGEVRVSLFCALQRATIEVLGAYQHRRAALQEVRLAVDEATAGRPYEHRLRDYNNDPATTLADLRAVIAVARSRVSGRLRALCRDAGDEE
jgi:hypothetical protein